MDHIDVLDLQVSVTDHRNNPQNWRFFSITTQTHFSSRSMWCLFGPVFGPSRAHVLNPFMCEEIIKDALKPIWILCPFPTCSSKTKDLLRPLSNPIQVCRQA